MSSYLQFTSKSKSDKTDFRQHNTTWRAEHNQALVFTRQKLVYMNVLLDDISNGS